MTKQLLDIEYLDKRITRFETFEFICAYNNETIHNSQQAGSTLNNTEGNMTLSCKLLHTPWKIHKKGFFSSYGGDSTLIRDSAYFKEQMVYE